MTVLLHDERQVAVEVQDVIEKIRIKVLPLSEVTSFRKKLSLFYHKTPEFDMRKLDGYGIMTIS